MRSGQLFCSFGFGGLGSGQISLVGWGFGWLAYKSRLWTDISDGWADGLMVGQVNWVDGLMVGQSGLVIDGWSLSNCGSGIWAYRSDISI